MKPKEYLQFLKAALKLKTTNISSGVQAGKPNAGVVVSLTSIPTRLNQLHYTIKSLLTQSMAPKKIVLWLNDSLKDRLPKSLTRLEGELFEIRYSQMTCSHRKLVHSLEAFPEDVIVTCDDDLIYPSDWLALLWSEHRQYPGLILTNRCNKIRYDVNGRTLPYTQWQKSVEPGSNSMAIMPAGYGGVLYPVGSLYKDVCDSDLFLRLTPTADDLWFKAMSFLKGTQCRRPQKLSAKPIPVPGTRGFTLATQNIKQDKNREQWDALRNYYNFKTPDET